ncbi:hypothetical protein JVU11DRAFT_7054 [Chiua virens]|nr:hypothetical protein JVU11DRAFT_7054 [Chiua virens]
MAPQTRGTTCDSIYEQPSLSPPRKTTIKCLAESTLAYDPRAEGNVTPAANHPADLEGLPTSSALSETGKGIHMCWQYASYDNDGDVEVEEIAAEVKIMVNEAHDIAAPPTTPTGPLDAARILLTFSEVPIAFDRYEPGSMVQAPVKKPKPFQLVPAFTRDNTSVRCVQYASYDNDDGAEVEEIAAEVEIMVDEAHDIAAPPTTPAGPRDAARILLTFSEIPIALDLYEPGSMALAPVKKLKPLRLGIRCMPVYAQDGVLRELDNRLRAVASSSSHWTESLPESDSTSHDMLVHKVPAVKQRPGARGVLLDRHTSRMFGQKVPSFPQMHFQG